jgi:hypothetical protein
VSWLSANVVHTPTGRTHRLPWGKRAAVNRHLALYGRTPAGWVVADLAVGDGEYAWVVKGDDKRQVGVASVSNDARTWMVARDGTALLKRVFTGGLSSVSVTRLSDGSMLADKDFDGEGRVLDFTGPQALLGVDGDTVLWEPGGDVASVGTGAVAGDVLHDVLMVPGTAPETVGPTTISEPVPPVWTAPLERVEVSPDGRFVLGLVSSDNGYSKHIQVRRPSDGKVVAGFHVRTLWRLTVQWEKPRSIIFMAGRTGLGDVNALVRCRLDGTCTRATAWRELRSLPMVRAAQTAD